MRLQKPAGSDGGLREKQCSSKEGRLFPQRLQSLRLTNDKCINVTAAHNTASTQKIKSEPESGRKSSLELLNFSANL